MHDVVIVGAGPAGLRLARLLKGLDVVVLEKNRTLGNKTCSGLVSVNIERFMEVDYSWIEHRVVGADVHFPYRDIKLRKPNVAAWVIDRRKFDSFLGRGLKCIRFGTSVNGVEVKKDRVVLKTSKGCVECKILVGCDGANSVVRKHFGERPEKVLSGVIAYAKKKDSSDRVNMWFDKRLLPDGFFWKIPRGFRTEYGAWGSKVTFKALRSFFKLGRCSFEAAPIPLGLIKTAFERTILLGDAACQVKPWSGGGIVWSFLAADIAAKKIKKALKGDLGALKEYDKEWKMEIKKHFKRGMLMRKVFRYTPDVIMNVLFRLSAKPEKLNRLDMDFL